MGIYKRYWKKYKIMFITGVSCVIMEALCDLMQPTIMSKMIDVGVKNNNINFVYSNGALMLLVAGAGALFAVIRNILAGKVSQNLNADLRYDLFVKIQRFSVSSLDELENASLITRLTNDVTQAAQFAGGIMRVFLKAPILCVGGIVMSVILNARLSAFLILAVIAVFLLIVWSMKLSYPMFSKVQRALDRLNRSVREYLLGVRLVKAFGRFKYEDEKFNEVNNNLTDRSLRAARVLTVFTPLMTLSMNLGIVLILWIGGNNLVSGSVQVGVIMALINYMTQILSSLMIVSNVFNMFVRMRASTERIQEVFEKTEERSEAPDIKAQSNPVHSLEFQNVTFSYPGSSSMPALQNISFSCKKGETIAIIGPTGSGKSTLVWLILRFYSPSSGEILINGKNIENIPLNVLRNCVSIAPQKSMLFSGTILENLLWGDADADFETVREAARISAAEPFINELPRCYDTVLEQGAVNLSGGQKQRLSLARALVKSPELLIIDDSTGALDTITEARVRRSLSKDVKKRITLSVTQRIGSAMSADKILVLENGCVTGFGAHSELMDTCREYREIYRSQLGE